VTSRKRLTRRSLLHSAGSFGLGLPLAAASAKAGWPFLSNADSAQAPIQVTRIPPPAQTSPLFPTDPTKYKFTADEDALLEEMERTSFSLFWEAVDPNVGLVKDRNLATGPDQRNVASIAATGFGLTALCIADQRGWQDSGEIRSRVLNTLRFALTRAPSEHGFFYHFMNMQTGERAFQSEVSSIDTAIFLCGALTCRAYFDDPEIQDLATRLYYRADWNWLLHNGKMLSMGWMPEGGFLRSNWDSYSELLMMPLLGLGSPTHSLPVQVWDNFARPIFEFNGIRYIGAHAPLFVHQYSHAWFDFRGKRDHYADYFTNSVIATKVHKIWCLELSREFPDYTDDLWGVTASDSPRGYAIWGGPPTMGRLDGSVVPCATAGSLPFLPEESIRVQRTIREKYGQDPAGPRAWQHYGCVDAFNPLTNWYSPDVLGIDAGISILMAENARTAFVWQQFMKNPEIQHGMDLAGFQDMPPEEANSNLAGKATAIPPSRRPVVLERLPLGHAPHPLAPVAKPKGAAVPEPNSAPEMELGPLPLGRPPQIPN
jgi:hypothetical protein